MTPSQPASDPSTWRVQPSPTVLGRHVAGDVLVCPPHGDVLDLRGTAAIVWSLADGSRSVREIAVHLAGTHGAPVARTQPEVVALVEDLVGRGALVVRAARAGGTVTSHGS